MLTITTTHLKAYYIRRNGIPASDKRTATEHWVRHGDILTVVTMIHDPVFLTEKLVRSQSVGAGSSCQVGWDSTGATTARSCRLATASYRPTCPGPIPISRSSPMGGRRFDPGRGVLR